MRLSDAEFWSLSQSISEPDGFFQSENYVSNEQQLQRVIPRFASLSAKARDVYLGVGPEQNYTYIAAIRPKIAFVIDIRRGNLLEHMLYKAIFELSEDRADFLSRLLNRPRPAGLNRASSISLITDRFAGTERDSLLLERNRAEIFDVLLKRHGFELTTADTLQLDVIYDMFFRGGLDLNYSYPRANIRQDATLYQLITAADSGDVQRGFLASDSAFQFVKDLHARNLIVPVVGDFAGPKAVRSIGAWVREHNAIVGTFYVSNVEQYLFQSGVWRSFYDNVMTMPIDSTSMFVRSMSNTSYSTVVRSYTTSYVIPDSSAIKNGAAALRGYRFTAGGPGFLSMTSTIGSILAGVRGASLLEYFDLQKISK